MRKSYVVAKTALLSAVDALISGPTGGTMDVVQSIPIDVPIFNEDGEVVGSRRKGFELLPAEVNIIRGGYAVIGRIGEWSAAVISSPNEDQLRQAVDSSLYVELCRVPGDDLDADFELLDHLNSILQQVPLPASKGGTVREVREEVCTAFNPSFRFVDIQI